MIKTYLSAILFFFLITNNYLTKVTQNLLDVQLPAQTTPEPASTTTTTTTSTTTTTTTEKVSSATEGTRIGL